MVLAEKETDHRIAWEKDALRANIQESKRGQILGAIISFSAVAGSVASVFLGAHPAVSVALVGVPVAAIVKAIVDARSPTALNPLKIITGTSRARRRLRDRRTELHAT